MNLLDPNAGVMVWTVLTFLIVVTILARLCWKPIIRSLDAREHRIREALEASERAKADAERIQKESSAILDRARAEADEVLAESRRDASVLREGLLKDAREESARTVERAKREVALAEQKAKDEIRREALALSFDLAERILKREIKPSDHESIARSVKDSIEGAPGARIEGRN